MHAPFVPSTLAELATRLEQRRHASARLAPSLELGAARALEDLDVSDLLDNENPAAGTNDTDRAHALQLALLAGRTADAAEGRLVAGRSSAA